MNQNPPEAKKPQSGRVTAVGGDWVICKSKKRNNQTYYFNTLTGQSVWTLSEANEDKAVIQTSQECPEPTEPASSPMLATSQANNVQITEPTAAPDVDYKIMLPPTISPQYDYAANSITTMGFVPQINNLNVYPGRTSEQFKKIVWNVPPPNHCPTQFVPPVALQPNPANKTAVPLSQRFSQINKPIIKPSHIMSTDVNTSVKSIRDNDLRIKLNAKRMMQQCTTSEHSSLAKDSYTTEIGMQRLNLTEEEETEPTYGNLKIIKNVTQEMSARTVVETDDDDQIRIGKNISHIDVSPLWKGAPDGVNTECWYIMADTNVYHGNLAFLNILIHSEERCHLLVPKTVLHELTRTSESVHAKAIDFLKPLLASGKAKTCDQIGTETKRCSCVDRVWVDPGNTKCLTGDDRILKCCVRAATSNYHVIFLSHDRILERKVGCTSIPFYKVDQIKGLINYKQEDENNYSNDFFTTIPDETQDNTHLDAVIHNVEEEREFTEPIEPYEDSEENFQEETVEEYIPFMVNINGPDVDPEIPMSISPELKREKKYIANLPLEKLSSENEFISPGNITAKPRTIRLNRKAVLRRSPTQTLKKPPLKWRRRPLAKPTCEKVTAESKTANDPPKFSPKSINKNIIQKPDHMIEVSQKVTETIDTENKVSPQGNDEVASSIGNPSSCCSKGYGKETSKIVEASPTATSSSCSKRYGKETSKIVRASSTATSSCCSQYGKETSKIVGASSTATSYSCSQRDGKETSKIVEASSTATSSCCSKRYGKETSKIVGSSSTAGSDVISNSLSSIYRDKPKLNLSNCSGIKRKPAGDIVPKPVDNTMVYHLRFGCEELVSLFVQIMEEMYTQVLLHIDIPKEKFPPLNLYEATENVKEIFRKKKEEEVSEDANNFLDFLLEFRDTKGNLRLDLNPEDYMRMFRCGEKLVQSLQRALPALHDILNGSLDALNVLLNDIRDPNLNDSFSFLDNDNEYESVAPTDDQPSERNLLATETNSQRLPLKPHSPIDYQETNKVQQMTFVRTAPKGALDDHRNLRKQQQGHQSNRDVDASNAAAIEINACDVPKKPGPKISCAFKFCPHIEEKLKLRARNADQFPRWGNYDEDMDYEEELEECEIGSDLEIDQYKATSIIEGHNINGNEAEDTSALFIENYEQSNAPFIKNMLLKEIKEIILYVNGFCHDTYSELKLNVKNLNFSRRCEIVTKVNDAYVLLETLLGNLKSILESQKCYDSESSIICLSKNSLRLSYREVILKFQDQAKVLIDALNSIKGIICP